MATQYETVIGMEVHVELETDTKVWCGCSTKFGAPPNTQVCPVCLGMPGSLPVLNRRAFEYAMRVGLALNCELSAPDAVRAEELLLPRPAEELSDFPVAQEPRRRRLARYPRRRATKRIGMDNIHLEEDAGKNLHPEHPGADYSLVDLNRAGTALLEIVSQPDMRGPEEALAYMDGLKNLLQYTGVSSCNMHEGRLRFEANISVRPVGSDKLGTKVEVKNLNSTKIVLKCIEYETNAADRRARIRRPHHSGDAALGRREKPDAGDALQGRGAGLPLFPRSQTSSRSSSTMPGWRKFAAPFPSCPARGRSDFVSQFGLPEYDAVVLTGRKELADYYESRRRAHNNPKAISNWIMTEILRLLNEGEAEVESLPVSAAHLAGLVRLIDDQTINGKIAKEVFRHMLEGEGDPAAIVKDAASPRSPTPAPSRPWSTRFSRPTKRPSRTTSRARRRP
jgi:aspartyl-tRNA(Asn)/glutamyl-tRNA(Gln) amidotransferase subunit B